MSSTVTVIHYCREKLKIKQCKFCSFINVFHIKFEAHLAPVERDGNPVGVLLENLKGMVHVQM